MKKEINIKNDVDEVLRKIGRNMMLFQQFEHLLKYIVANGKFSGFASELKDLQLKRVATVNKQTMGQLVGQYINSNDPDYEDDLGEHEIVDETFFSFSFRTECDSIYYETKKEALAKIVSERNELIHHLLPHFDTTSDESCKKLGTKLDAQADEVRKEITELKSKVQALDKGRKQLVDFFASDEGKMQFEQAFLRGSRLVILIGDIAEQMARSDGWTLMNIAGQLLKKHAPEEIAVLKDKYGHKSLKGLVQAVGIFDIYEEPTDKGGIRLLFRLSSGWKLSHA